MQVPFVDLSREANSILEEIIQSTRQVISSGIYINGENVKKFEKEFALYCGVNHAISVGNGSDALTFIMKGLNIGENDEVICPGNSFIASAWSIAATGATPVFCDVEDDLLLSVETISKCLTPKTKAVMAVHLTGKICNLDLIAPFCEKKNLFLIEDAAQSIGSISESGQRSGSYGVAGAFSLHPLKNLAVYGDGGVVTTNSEYLSNQIKLLRNHGLVNRDESLIWGFNSRLDELQAAYGIIKLKYIEEWTKKYIEIANQYSSKLTNKIIKPITRKNCRDVFHNYVILVPPNFRDLIMKKLSKLEIETKIHYPIPLHLQKCSSKLGYKNGDIPNVERLAKSMISLPIYPSLTQYEINYIINSINQIITDLL